MLIPIGEIPKRIEIDEDDPNESKPLANQEHKLDKPLEPRKPASLTISKTKNPKIWTLEKSIRWLEDMYIWFEDNPKKKCLVDYFAYHDGDHKRMWRVEKDYPQLRPALKKIKYLLESRLLEHGEEARNPAFSIFLLKNHHDYVDRIDQRIDANLNVSQSDLVEQAYREREAQRKLDA